MVIDTNLIEAAVQGDKESFAQVYDIISSDLYKVALYTLGNTYDAEDVVSETFIEAYKGITSLRDSTKFKAWMFKILSVRCKRKITEYIKGKNEFDIELFMTTLADDNNLSSDISEQATLMQAMARLSLTERQIVVLSVLQGYTTKEIASILASPHGTVSSKLHRALAKLRAMLENDRYN